MVVDDKNQMAYDSTEPAVIPTYATKEWVTNGGFDFVDGWVSSKNYSVTHERKIFFVRNEYWIISDLLTGSGSHTFDQYWHLPAISWTVVPSLDEISGRVTSAGNGLLIVPSDPTTIRASIVDDFVSDRFTQSRTVKYSKSGKVPASFETVIFPYPATAPAVTINRLDLRRGATSVTPTTASGIRIDIMSNEDYFLIAHDGETTVTEYGVFQYDGKVAYVRKEEGGFITNIQIEDGTSLAENGTNLATTYGVRAQINARNYTVEIDAPTTKSPKVTKFSIWCPSATSVKIDGKSVGFVQNGNYVGDQLARKQ